MSSDLFSAEGVGERLGLEGADLTYFKSINLPEPRELILNTLITQTPWREEDIVIYGKTYKQPRLIAWYGDWDKVYRYSGVTFNPQAWSPLLLEIKKSVELVCGRSFNSALLNYYRDQNDSVGMHSDDEPELGSQPVIASVSLGAERVLIFKKKPNGKRYKLTLADTSLLLMKGDTQKNWQHGIEKEKHPCAARINITFRTIVRP